MLRPGHPIFLLLPDASGAATLHSAQVLEADAAHVVACLHPLPAPLQAGAALTLYAHVNGVFFAQDTRLIGIHSKGRGDAFLLARSGPLRPAERRSIHRLPVACDTLFAQIDQEPHCPLVDISPEGFAVLAEGRHQVGSVVPISLKYQDLQLSGPARVQTMQPHVSGQRRYGFRVLQQNVPVCRALEEITARLQKMQLERVG